MKRNLELCINDNDKINKFDYSEPKSNIVLMTIRGIVHKNYLTQNSYS